MDTNCYMTLQKVVIISEMVIRFGALTSDLIPFSFTAAFLSASTTRSITAAKVMVAELRTPQLASVYPMRAESRLSPINFLMSDARGASNIISRRIFSAWIRVLH
jgi:hypothetical protein